MCSDLYFLSKKTKAVEKGFAMKDATPTPWAEIIAQSEENEEAVMEARQGDAAQIELAEEKVEEAQEKAAPFEQK
jgi:hypothetical protein